MTSPVAFHTTLTRIWAVSFFLINQHILLACKLKYIVNFNTFLFPYRLCKGCHSRISVWTTHEHYALFRREHEIAASVVEAGLENPMDIIEKL